MQRPRCGWGWRAECHLRERARGRGTEGPRDGRAAFPRSLSHQSRNPGLTLGAGVKPPCLGAPPSQPEDLQGPCGPPRRGCRLAGAGGDVTSGQMAAEPCAGEPRSGGLGVPVCGADPANLPFPHTRADPALMVKPSGTPAVNVFLCPRLSFVGYRLQPPGPPLSPRGQIQTAVDQGRADTDTRGTTCSQIRGAQAGYTLILPATASPNHGYENEVKSEAA